MASTQELGRLARPLRLQVPAQPRELWPELESQTGGQAHSSSTSHSCQYHIDG